MLTIIDKYILKRYLVTFFVMLFLFIPIGIVIDVAEKINKILEAKVPFAQVAQYYFDFTIYFASLLFPIFLFLSVIWFTSKLANNTEIIAILSSGISFNRFLKPYLIGATVVSIFALLLGFFLVPNASKGFNNFRYQYLKKNATVKQNSNVFRQLSKDEFIYVSNYNDRSKMAFNFTYEKFKGNKLEYKITAQRIKWNEKDSTYFLYDYKKRIVGEFNDKIIKLEKKDTLFNFDLEDLTPVIYIAETLTLPELYRFIDKEKARGNANIDVYLVVLYKKFSLPVTAFILTLIAVSVSSMKRRGGMGVNLAIGISLAFVYVFFDKIFATLAEKSSISPLLAVWLPNIVFGLLAIYLLKNAKR